MPFDKYDEIVVHTCTKHEARLPPLKAELARIGINAIFQYNDESAHANVRETLERAGWNGYKRVLCLEDDVRFLRDKDRVAWMFKDAPEGKYDICSFDNFIHASTNIVAQIRLQPNGWVDYHASWNAGMQVYGASCWSFGERAAKVLLSSYDTHPKEPPDSRLFMAHQDLKSVWLSTPACVQMFYEGCMNDEKGWRFAHHAGYIFVGYEHYNLPEGYKFGSSVKMGEA